MTYHVSYHVIMFQVYDYIIYFQHCLNPPLFSSQYYAQQDFIELFVMRRVQLHSPHNRSQRITYVLLVLFWAVSVLLSNGTLVSYG